MLDGPYSDAEIDAAVQALAAPDRLAGARDTVARLAPQLQPVLDQALTAGGWFGEAHENEVRRVAEVEDSARAPPGAVRTLVAEETRLGMLVGVAVGIELARELSQAPRDQGGVMEIRFLGHAAFELSDGDTRVLIDPFLSGNPKAAAEPGELDPTTILLTHGHADHIGDTVDIAKRSGAPVVAIVELAGEIGEERGGGPRPQPGGDGQVRLGVGQARCRPGTPRPRPRAP